MEEYDKRKLALVEKYCPKLYADMKQNWSMGMVYDYLECAEKDYKTEDEFVEHLKGLNKEI